MLAKGVKDIKGRLELGNLRMVEFELRSIRLAGAFISLSA